MAELIENGYKMCGQRLNEEIDTMIDEVHKAYMNHTNEEAKIRLDAQMKILWSFKDKIENAIVDGMAMPTTTEAEIRQQAITDFVEHITLPLTTEEDIARILEQLGVERWQS